MDKKTETVRKRYNRSAALFDWSESVMERGRMGEWRKLIWSQATGRILEVGLGTGKNFAHYPHGADVTAIDFSENMLSRARARAERLGIRATILQMDVQALEFEDETFDTVISTCVFCSVPDPVKGLMELRRVCKKDGKILMLEHVRSRIWGMGILMDMMNPIVVRIVGANINRDTLDNLHRAGLTVTRDENLLIDIVKQIECKR